MTMTTMFFHRWNIVSTYTASPNPENLSKAILSGIRGIVPQSDESSGGFWCKLKDQSTEGWADKMAQWLQKPHAIWDES